MSGTSLGQPLLSVSAIEDDEATHETEVRRAYLESLDSKVRRMLHGVESSTTVAADAIGGVHVERSKSDSVGKRIVHTLLVRL